MTLSRSLRRRRRAAVLAAAASLTVWGAGAAAAATGDLDPTWSGDGIATQAAGSMAALASVAQADGKILVAGTGTVADGSTANGGTYVARYTTAGALDTTWGTGGLTKLSIAPGAEFAREIVLDPSGRALVGGYVTAPDYPDETDVFVLRLTPAGAPDTTFGTGGIVKIDRTNHDRGAALAFSGSRILVGTGLDFAGNFGLQWTVFALTASGALDNTFSGDGAAEVPVAKVGSFDSLRDIAVQADGKIVLGGTSGAEFASARMNAAGVLDATYDGDGVARTLVENGGAGYKLLIQPDKKIVVAGYATAAGRSDTDFAAVRWTPAGKLDTTFSGDGKAILDTGERRNNRAQSAALAADGKIVLVGSTDTATGMDSALGRLDWDGSADTSFSGDGIMSTSTLATSNEQLEAVSVVAGDKIRTFGANLQGWTLLGYTGGANYTVSVGAATMPEPDSGTANLTFVVTMHTPNPQPVTVKWATTPGTATAPGDFTTRSGVVTIPANGTGALITVPIVGDTVPEATETFTVKLSLPTNAGINFGTAVGTIQNDD